MSWTRNANNRELFTPRGMQKTNKVQRSVTLNLPHLAVVLDVPTHACPAAARFALHKDEDAIMTRQGKVCQHWKARTVKLTHLLGLWNGLGTVTARRIIQASFYTPSRQGQWTHSRFVPELSDGWALSSTITFPQAFDLTTMLNSADWWNGEMWMVIKMHDDLSPIPALKWIQFASFDRSWHLSSSTNVWHWLFFRFYSESTSPSFPCCVFGLWWNSNCDDLIGWSCWVDWQLGPFYW